MLLIFILPILLVLSSSIVYYIERGDYIDGKFCAEYIDNVCYKSEFNSVLVTFWWCIQTISTLGYGDITPKTFTGRLFGAATAVIGWMVMAFPVAVLGNNFSKEWKKKPPSSVLEGLNTSEKEYIQQREQMKIEASLLPNYHPRRLYFLFRDPNFSLAASRLHKAYMIIVIVSVIAVSYDSTRGYGNQNDIFYLETAIVIFFTIEFIITSILTPKAVRYRMSVTTFLDLASILPYYLGLIPGISVPSLSILRVIRLARLFKIFKYSRSSHIFKCINKSFKKNLDVLMLLLFVLGVEVILSSSIMFYFERGTFVDGKGWYYNGQRSKFQSVPETFWWSIVTLSTVGYGDYIPNTWVGKSVAGITVICGILTVALPITIMRNSFCDEWAKYMSTGSAYKPTLSTVEEEKESPDVAKEASASAEGNMTLFERAYDVTQPHHKKWNVLSCILHTLSGVLAMYSMTEKISNEALHYLVIIQSILVSVSVVEALCKIMSPHKGKNFILVERILGLYSFAVLIVSIIYDKSFQGLLSVRLFWAFRIFYLFPTFKISREFFAVVDTLYLSSDSLFLLGLLEFVLVVLFSSIMWCLERGELKDDVWIINDTRSKFQSIPDTFWWTVVTMATVGYGDVTPLTIGGRIFAGLVICAGILVIAFPVAILSSNFSGIYSQENIEENIEERIEAWADSGEEHVVLELKRVLSRRLSHSFSESTKQMGDSITRSAAHLGKDGASGVFSICEKDEK